MPKKIENTVQKNTYVFSLHRDDSISYRGAFLIGTKIPDQEGLLVTHAAQEGLLVSLYHREVRDTGTKGASVYFNGSNEPDVIIYEGFSTIARKAKPEERSEILKHFGKLSEDSYDSVHS